MYELVFWNYKEGIYINNHLVYEAISEEQSVDGLEELPTSVIVNRINSLFSNRSSAELRLFQLGVSVSLF
jgi:hypothetical protein